MFEADLSHSRSENILDQIRFDQKNKEGRYLNENNQNDKVYHSNNDGLMGR